AAWKERQTAAPIIAAIMQLGLEKKIEFPPPKPEKLIANNFERFAGLLKWYAELLGTPGSSKRKEAAITAKFVWRLPKALAQLNGKPLPAAEPVALKALHK
ncbi:MAG: hypothetical protein B0A82_17425, partial [Alkalinema sp. CACIAM 70d]